MKRSRPSNTNHLACNGTLEVRYTGPSDFIVRQIGQGDFEDGLNTDSVDLVIHFRPPLAAPMGTLIVDYVGAKHVENTQLCAQPLLPLNQGQELVLRAQELEYRCYPRYNIHVKDGKIMSLHLSVENTNTNSNGGGGDGSYDLVLQLHVNTRLEFMARHLGKRGRFLEWFPPDVDPAQWGLRIDPRKIPQRTPLWFKLRGDVSGSKAYSFLGWFFSNSPGVFNAFQKSAMRLGTFSEDLIVLIYCSEFPDRIFEEVGWCPAIGYPVGWGASPDGLVMDPQMSWDQVPPALRKHYEKGEIPLREISYGACEFKTSRTKLGAEGYFLAQIYMEMIALQVVWCDLVRYRPAREWNADEGRWMYNDMAHVYRVFRDPAMESRLLPLWKRAQANQHALAKLIQEPEFVQIRFDLEQQARQLEPYRIIKVAEQPLLEELLLEYQAYKKGFDNLVVPEQQQQQLSEQQQLDWILLESRHLELQRHTPGSPAFIQLIGEQIKGYASLLLL